MTDRYNDEIDHLNDGSSKPEPESPEGSVSPLITQDYGDTDAMNVIAQLARSPGWTVRVTTLVNHPTRYVVEIEAVSTCSPGVAAILSEPEWLPDF